MDSAVNLLGTVGGIIAIIGAIVGVWMFAKGSYNKARIQALREDNDDLRKRVDDADKELEKCNARADKHELELKNLHTENALLRELVSQRVEFTEMIGMLNEHHDKSMHAWEDIRLAIEGRS